MIIITIIIVIIHPDKNYNITYILQEYFSLKTFFSIIIFK